MKFLFLLLFVLLGLPAYGGTAAVTVNTAPNTPVNRVLNLAVDFTSTNLTLTSPNVILYSNGSGFVVPLNLGAGLTLNTATNTLSSNGGGTVTNFIDGTGFFTIGTSTTTPTMTLTAPINTPGSLLSYAGLGSVTQPWNVNTTLLGNVTNAANGIAQFDNTGALAVKMKQVTGLRSSFSGTVIDIGVLAYATDTNTLYIGDGSTAGGVAISGGGSSYITSLGGNMTHFSVSVGVLNLDAPLGSNAFTSTAYAPLASPALTGTPTAPTAAGGTNTTQLATTAFVANAISGITPYITALTTTGSSGAATVSGTTLNIPNYTVSANVTGLRKSAGNGTTDTAAAAGTDYQSPISLTTTGTSGAATFVGNVLNIPQYIGGVTSVTAGDTTLTISPTSGAVVAALNLARANTWTDTITVSKNTTGNLLFLDGGTSGGTYAFNNTSAAGPGLIITTPSAASTQGAYLSLIGNLESQMNYTALGNTSGRRVMRFGNKTDRFSLALLNDAGTSITATPFSFANAAPSNSFYMLASGAILLGSATDDSSGAVLQLTGSMSVSTATASTLTKFDANKKLISAVSGTDYQAPISLTTTGTSGAATFSANVLNIPQYTGGAGTVTTFTAGTLSPLFTTSVATASTTPALTFSLTNAAANTIFGNSTSSSAAPAYNATSAYQGTTSTTFAAGNDTRITGALQAANNLSDVASAATSRTNLGATTVGANILTLPNPSAVTWNRVNADNTVSSRTAAQTLSDIGAQASGSYLTVSNNLSDVNSASTSRTNLGATTVGANLFTLPNPGAVTWNRVNADNSVSSRTAAQTLVDLGAQGTVTLTTTGTSGAATFTSNTLNIPNYSSGAFTSPMTTLGDIIYENSTPAAARLAGNTTTTQKFLGQAGNGTISAAPTWFDLYGTAATWGAAQTWNGTGTFTANSGSGLAELELTGQPYSGGTSSSTKGLIEIHPSGAPNATSRNTNGEGILFAMPNGYTGNYLSAYANNVQKFQVDATGAVSASGASTFSAAGAASAPALTLSGAPFSGGSGTTTFPLVYLNGGTAPTTWSTNGTVIGVNSPNGFVGNIIDLHSNGGTSLFSINSSGTVAVASSISSTATIAAGVGSAFSWTGRSRMSSPADGDITLFNSGSTAFTSLKFGGSTSSFPEWKRNAAAFNARLADDSADAAITASTIGASGDVTVTGGNIIAATAGKGLQIKGGSNAKIGTGTLVAGTATISTTAITANSRIFLTDTSTSTTNVGSLTVSATSAGTSFTVTSTLALDTSTFNWMIVEQN